MANVNIEVGYYGWIDRNSQEYKNGKIKNRLWHIRCAKERAKKELQKKRQEAFLERMIRKAEMEKIYKEVRGK